MNSADERFGSARLVADAVLYEGYVLYPYRASATKNQMRWQFGVLAPHDYATAAGTDRASMRTELIVNAGAHAVVTVRVRCLHLQRREVGAAIDGGAGFAPVAALDVDGKPVPSWDEAIEREIDIPPLSLAALRDEPCEHRFTLADGCDEELVDDSSGNVVGRVTRRRERVDGIVRVAVEPLTADVLRLSVAVENATSAYSPDVDRDEAMRRSLLGAHTLLAIDDGAFVSALEPPPEMESAVAGCMNAGTFPVLIGPEGSHDVVLSSPIILYDHPAVAPESAGDFCDATEIDEILALRVLTLTDEEKAEARGTDARAAAIIDRCDDMPDEIWTRLHGAVRALRPADGDATPSTPSTPWWDPGLDAAFDPFTDTITIGRTTVGSGTRVRLRPSRRADAHDLFYAGRLATVKGVFNDVDGERHVAVALDDDPASDLLEWQGRFLYFHPDEIEVLA